MGGGALAGLVAVTVVVVGNRRVAGAAELIFLHTYGYTHMPLWRALGRFVAFSNTHTHTHTHIHTHTHTHAHAHTHTHAHTQAMHSERILIFEPETSKLRKAGVGAYGNAIVAVKRRYNNVVVDKEKQSMIDVRGGAGRVCVCVFVWREG